MRDLLGYQGKTVVITGCATGMGAAAAEHGTPGTKATATRESINERMGIPLSKLTSLHYGS